MNERRTLLQYHELTVEVETSPGKELMEHMHQTVLGQPGGVRYQHTDLEDRMNSGDENYFMYLRKSGKMLGSVGFCSKPTDTAGFEHDSWLIRYFSIKAPMRSVPRKRKSRADLRDENKRTTVLGRFIQPLFADPSQLREGETRADQPAIIFATIDRTNLRSMNFSSQMGLETVGSFAAFSFSRMKPGRSERIESVEEKERTLILNQIKDYYKDYTLFYTDAIFQNNDYYVIKQGGRMVAGLQIYPVVWKIVDLGSQLANSTVGLITRIPWVRKRFSPDELSFLALDAIYCEKGSENVLYELIEGVLERTGNYIAMMMMDTESDLYKLFRDRRKFGILHKIMGTSMAEIRMRFINMPDDVKQKFYERPTYIPTYDNS
jgi:hypothetical protein